MMYFYIVSASSKKMSCARTLLKLALYNITIPTVDQLLTSSSLVDIIHVVADISTTKKQKSLILTNLDQNFDRKAKY